MQTSFTSKTKNLDPLRAHEIKIGDTALLTQFINYCARFEEGLLFFTAPYYDVDFMSRVAKKFHRSGINFEVVVKDESAAMSINKTLGGTGTVLPRIYQHLHAKVYIFQSVRRDFAALIGSHNPTLAGSSKNLEVGVYIGARPSTPEWFSVFELRERIRDVSSALPELPPRNHKRRSLHV